jgi:hypothetical protein
MWKRLLRRRAPLAVALVLAVAGLASAAVVFSPGAAMPMAVPVPAGAYTMPLTINTAAAPAGYGDTIIAVETGRDDRSPYCAIVVDVGFANPAMAQLQSLQQGWPWGGAVPGYPLARTIRER